MSSCRSRRSYTGMPDRASPRVLVGRPASPARLNGALRLGPYIALNNQVIRPWREPAKNWENRAGNSRCTGTNPLSVNEWVASGRTTVFSGPPPHVRCGGYGMGRTDAAAHAAAEPGLTPSEPVWLFGRMHHAVTRLKCIPRN